MTKNRLEAFSDGVIAIIITIMVLELKVPTDPSLNSLYKLLPIFSCYALSFFLVAIMWINHHALIHEIKRVNVKILWANNFLLFIMSLIPFTSAYMGESKFVPHAVFIYGINIVFISIGFSLLRKVAMKGTDQEFSALNKALIRKNHISAIVQCAAAFFAFVSIYPALILLFVMPLTYVVPSLLKNETEH